MAEGRAFPSRLARVLSGSPQRIDDFLSEPLDLGRILSLDHDVADATFRSAPLQGLSNFRT